MRPDAIAPTVAVLAIALTLARGATAAESPWLYGIFDADPAPSEYLSHIAGGGARGWITATVAVGANTNDLSGADFSALADQGHTVICRINHGYFPDGTIPLPSRYDDFAKRCANFVVHSTGCNLWTIGNELNIAGEWPFDPATNRFNYVSPQSYADCFRKVCSAIKAVRPDHKVLPAAPAPFAGPFGEGTLSFSGQSYPHDANPLNWVNHLRQMLTAITATGPLDGIALHVTSRGYACADIHSQQKVNAAGQSLFFSFYVYKDWIDLGIPSSLYTLPLYATECNGYYFWQGGHPEDPAAHYEPGWVQEIYAEINRYNQNAVATGKPVFRCFNLYRWCGACDGWGISGNPYTSEILADLDEAVAKQYTWPTNFQSLVPIGLNFIDPGAADDTIAMCDVAGVVPQNAWFNLTAGGNGTLSLGGGASVTWASPGGGTHELPISNLNGDFGIMQGYLDTGDTTTTTVTVNGLKFALYDVIVYAAGDNTGSPGEYRVGKYTLNNRVSKYVRDDPTLPDFDGTFTEADSLTGGASTPVGNYVRFRNVTGSSFSVAAKGEYASGNPKHPRAPFNALQIVPLPAVPTLADASWSAGGFQCFVIGATNANYVVQASTNLSTWVPLKTNAAPFLFRDLVVPAPALRFYRALLQQ